MLDRHADLLSLIRDSGGTSVKSSSGEYLGVFDNDFLLAGEVEERSPVVTMRTIDVIAGGFDKDAIIKVVDPVEAKEKSYRVRRLEPDGTGMTLVILQVA